LQKKCFNIRAIFDLEKVRVVDNKIVGKIKQEFGSLLVFAPTTQLVAAHHREAPTACPLQKKKHGTCSLVLFSTRLMHEKADSQPRVFFKPK
jgi:hypothetical protein